MLNPFNKKSERHRSYKKLFVSWERYLLTHENDVFAISVVATQCAIVTLDPVARSYKLPTVHDSDALIKRVKPDDLRAMSETCFVQAKNYRQETTERSYQGAILAGLYFGVAGLVAEGERGVSGLWRQVSKAMLLTVKLAAKSTEHQRSENRHASSADKARTQPVSLHPKIAKALEQIGMSEAKYRAIDVERDQELASIGEERQKHFGEQQRLFAEIEKISEETSPAEIYGASMSIMNVFERVMSRGGPVIRVGEPEVVAAGVAKFIDRLYEADDENAVAN